MPNMYLVEAINICKGRNLFCYTLDSSWLVHQRGCPQKGPYKAYGAKSNTYFLYVSRTVDVLLFHRIEYDKKDMFESKGMRYIRAINSVPSVLRTKLPWNPIRSITYVCCL